MADQPNHGSQRICALQTAAGAPAAQATADRAALRTGMQLSLWIGVVMLVMKLAACFMTGSAAILSDAAESVVHVVAVGFAAYSLRLSYAPADADHPYGHAKISFFSAGFEGAMIAVAALYIIYEAVARWMAGLHLQHLGLGTLITAAAAAINAILGAYLLRLGRNKHSVILEADGQHVLTDVWTSLGVIVGLCLVLLTGWLPWDPICAILVACNILITGFGLIRRGISGLMDTADPQVQRQVEEILRQETARHGLRYHSLRHRSLGVCQLVDVHLLFPENTPIRQAHEAATAIEQAVESTLQPCGEVTTHLESIEGHREAHDRHTA
jgi:cation diffusion facilitator family transporter